MIKRLIENDEQISSAVKEFETKLDALKTLHGQRLVDALTMNERFEETSSEFVSAAEKLSLMKNGISVLIDERNALLKKMLVEPDERTHSIFH